MLTPSSTPSVMPNFDVGVHIYWTTSDSCFLPQLYVIVQALDRELVGVHCEGCVDAVTAPGTLTIRWNL